MRITIIILGLLAAHIHASEIPSPRELTEAIIARVASHGGDARLDRDGDGAVSRLEGLAACAGLASWLRINLPDIFHRLDQNADNGLSPDEVTACAALDNEVRFEVALRTIQAGARRTQQRAFVARQKAAANPDPLVGRIGYDSPLTISEFVITAHKR